MKFLKAFPQKLFPTHVKAIRYSLVKQLMFQLKEKTKSRLESIALRVSVVLCVLNSAISVIGFFQDY